RAVKRTAPVDHNLVDESVVEDKEATRRNTASNEQSELEEEYAYVMQDLRRVFILAAVLFILLIALNLLLG
ncbi:MAG: hypothetical protein ACK2T3_09770, partial [Candidatus Promineifilaceae bacterium]